MLGGIAMDIDIRPVRLEDAPYIYGFRIMDGVRENILLLPSERVSKIESLISGLTDNQHMFVAGLEEDGVKKVVGSISLNVNKSPRVRHSGSIGITVDRDYHGNGIGRALLNKIVDLADNWLMLVRLDLEVFTDNQRAINLYRSSGFVIEGTKKYAAVKDGKYQDEYLMARYNLSAKQEA